MKLTSPVLSGNKEFNERVSLFKKIDHLLVSGGVENALKLFMINKEELELGHQLEVADQIKLQRNTSLCLRTNIARVLSGRSFKEFAVELSDSFTLQSFCGYDHPSVKKVPSRSKLHTLSQFIPSELINKTIDELSKYLFQKKNNLNVEFDCSSLFMDSTCMELNIHHPVDWVLLKDAVITIMKSIKNIRSHGIKHRIAPPDDFIKQVNNISMAITMTKTVRNGDAKKKRKGLFRKLKALLKTCEGHGNRYLKVLQSKWNSSDLSFKEAEQISNRMINVLSKVDEVIHQAHERVIGERQVRNTQKILSLYEQHAKVYKRGKSGADVEFGLQLFIAESVDGLIVNWNIHDSQPKHDSSFVKPCIKALQSINLNPKNVSGDRGFSKKKTSDFLSDEGINDYVCPKNKALLNKKLKSKKFREFANRRSQTEGRIGIIKNKFLGGVLRTKGFENQKTEVAWAVLAHNLWVAARKISEPEELPLKLAS